MSTVARKDMAVRPMRWQEKLQNGQRSHRSYPQMKKTLTIKWNKITGAYGYRIKRSTDEDGTYKVVKTIKSGNTTSYKDTSVKAGKTYYYTVETMVKTGDNICYSGDSASVEGRTAKKTKIKYAVSNGSNQIEVNWEQ